jgi:AcrR family transcriptional regulator
VAVPEHASGPSWAAHIDYGYDIVNSGRVASTPEHPGKRAYRSVGRQNRARATRARILDAAREVFLARGYAGTTMHAVAVVAGVSVPTVELVFGTKPGLLKAAIDVAIAGDDEPVAVLDRDWASTAMTAGGVEPFLAAVVEVLAAAQQRSAGLVMAAFEAAGTHPELADLSDQLVGQREVVAGWIVDRLRELAGPRAGLSRVEAVETVWLLMEPALFVRLTRDRERTMAQYRAWIAWAVRSLVLPERPDPKADR